MTDGWYFNGDAGTPVIRSAGTEEGWLFQYWKEMPTSTLHELLEALSMQPLAWQTHIRNIKKELLSRPPPEVLVAVSVNGKI